MNIADAKKILKAELLLGRTPSGWPINKEALELINASLQDEKNANMPTISCKNCCIIISSLLFKEGCPNCRLKMKMEEKS